MKPLKQVQNVSTIQATRMSVGSRSKYSASPPQTPAIFLSDDNVNRLFMSIRFDALPVWRIRHFECFAAAYRFSSG